MSMSANEVVPPEMVAEPALSVAEGEPPDVPVVRAPVSPVVGVVPV